MDAASWASWASIQSARTAIVVLVIFYPGPSASEAGVTTADVIENVRRNEALYENLDVTMQYSYELSELQGARETKLTGGTFATSTHLTSHYVAQDGMFRLDNAGSSVTAEGPKSADRIRAFDRETTRSYYGLDGVGNVASGRLLEAERIEPHRFLLRPIRETCVPLSVFLSGADAVRAHPLGQRNNLLPDQFLLKSLYKGEEEWRGFRCHRIDSLMAAPSGETIHRYEFLLAEDRNYIPVRMRLYTFTTSRDKPVAEAEVTEMREIAPAVWFPFAGWHAGFNQLLMWRDGSHLVMWRETYATEAASLTPAYSREYFSDVPFPAGTRVYVVANGEIQRSYIDGANPSGNASPSRYVIWTLNALVICVATAMLITRWRRERVERQPKSESAKSFVSFRLGCVNWACRAARMAPAGRFRRTDHESARQQCRGGFDAGGCAL